MTLFAQLLLVLLSASLLTHGRQLYVSQSEDASLGNSESENVLTGDWDEENKLEQTPPVIWYRNYQPENKTFGDNQSVKASQDDRGKDSQSEEVYLDEYDDDSPSEDPPFGDRQSEKASPDYRDEESQSEEVYLDEFDDDSPSKDAPLESSQSENTSPDVMNENGRLEDTSLVKWYKDKQTENSISDSRRFKRETNDIYWDKVIDNILEDFREKTKQEIALPDIHKTYNVPVFKALVPYLPSLNLDGSQGYLRSVHSIHRLGHVNVSGQTLTALFRFGSLRLRYEDFKTAVMKVGLHGRLDATVEDNALRVRARIERSEDECRILYEDIEMVHLDMVKLKMTGLGPLNRFYSFLATKVVKVLKDCVSNSLERLFASNFRSMFENYPFKCE